MQADLIEEGFGKEKQEGIECDGGENLECRSTKTRELGVRDE